MDQKIGPYQLLHQIGEGGMGKVFAALDERLERTVALKLLIDDGATESRERFWREAKLAAQLNHPNICQVYDVGEEESQPYLAMELLDGEPLATRIARGPIEVGEALAIITDVLNGLAALHRQGIVHRDLKPTNIFLVSTGAKLLDFGLARSLAPTDVELTQPGLLIGTPRYMAPEQWVAQPVSPATDLFAASSILYEMLSGSFAFPGETAIEIYTAVTKDQPPALTGADTIDAIDRVIHRGLAKKPDDRFSSATAMLEALEGSKISDDRTLVELEVRQITRLMVLPFRLLRPDEEIGFLSFSLADAVTASLSGMRSLVVRSKVASGQSSAESPDLAALAREGDVDAVLFGTLLRGGDRVRLTTQLVQVPDGTVLATNTAEAPLDDVFVLQDELADKVTQSLAVPLGEREERQERRDVPSNGEAYEKYLRANELAQKTLSASLLKAARDLYSESVKLDPSFAPAWARLGRVHRVLAKYGYADVDASRKLAEEAFDKALEINPELPLTHNLLTFFQIEEQANAAGAMERLLERLARVPDPDLFAGLVAACRFCGLPEASIAAHQEATRLNPTILTSVAYTYWVVGDLERAIETEGQDVPFMRLYAFIAQERFEEARELADSIERQMAKGLDSAIFRAQRSAIAGDVEACRVAEGQIRDSSFADPEGLFYVARSLVQIGDTEDAIDMFESIVDSGYLCMHLFGWDPQIALLESNERFHRLAARSREASEAALTRFLAAGGPQLLGLQA
jgi:serine/threonine protein kinase/tetratricopeptide (TPR) repeat protein